MEYVLIVLLLGAAPASAVPSSIATAVFNSEDRCLAAAAKIESDRQKYWLKKVEILSVCAPR
jgi:hypothetical protein